MTSEELNNRFGVTDDQLEEWSEEMESGTIPGSPEGAIVIGRPKLYGSSQKSLMGISFKESPEIIARLDEKAKSVGKTRSEYIRFLISQDLSMA